MGFFSNLFGGGVQTNEALDRMPHVLHQNIEQFYNERSSFTATISQEAWREIYGEESIFSQVSREKWLEVFNVIALCIFINQVHKAPFNKATKEHLRRNYFDYINAKSRRSEELFMDLSNYLQGDVYAAGMNVAYSIWVLKQLFYESRAAETEEETMQAMERGRAVQQVVKKIEMALVRYEA